MLRFAISTLNRIVLLLIALFVSGVVASAQSNATGQAPTETRDGLGDAPSYVRQQERERVTTVPKVESEAELRARAQRELEAEEQQRILAVVPNFNTVISGEAARLSKKQKTELALHSTFDPFNAVGAFVLAGASELGGSHRGFGWGPEGYFKRVGANGADIVVGTMLAGAAYPILLHQDPRFFRKGKGSVPSRVSHALLGAFICRGDNGRRQPNFSNVLGNFTGGLISNAYYPSDETGIGLSLVNSSIVTLEGSLGNLALEFSPDVSRWWHNRKNKKATNTALAGTSRR